MDAALLREVVRLGRAGRPCVMATVISAIGTAPRQAGSAMLIFADGQTQGSIGGGRVEYLVREAAMELLERNGKPLLLELDVHPDQAGADHGGGRVKVFLQRVSP